MLFALGFFINGTVGIGKVYRVWILVLTALRWILSNLIGCNTEIGSVGVGINKYNKIKSGEEEITIV